MNDDVDLLKVAKDFLRHRRIVAAMTALGCAAGVALALLSAPQYESTSKVLLSQSTAPASQFASISSMLGISLNQPASPLDNVPQLLASPLFLDTLTKIRWRTVGTDTAKLLSEIYPSEVKPNPRKAPHISEEMLRQDLLHEIVLDMITFENMGGVKALTVRARDPYLAHDVNEFLLGYIDDYINHVRKTNSKHQLSFVEERLEEYGKELRRSENALRHFLEKNRMASSPDLQLEQKRLERELHVNEAIVADLRKQLENSRIEVERDIEVLNVFQEPDLPMWPVKPKKKLIAAAGLVGGCCAGMLLSFLLCWWRETGRAVVARLKELP